jgi:hypothetical protein
MSQESGVLIIPRRERPGTVRWDSNPVPHYQRAREQAAARRKADVKAREMAARASKRDAQRRAHLEYAAGSARERMKASQRLRWLDIALFLVELSVLIFGPEWSWGFGAIGTVIFAGLTLAQTLAIHEERSVLVRRLHELRQPDWVEIDKLDRDIYGRTFPHLRGPDYAPQEEVTP